jgi:hypothetical protein
VLEIYTQAYSYPKQATHQKSKTLELACTSYAQDTLLLSFKLTQKVFGFKPKSSNKSCRIYFKDSNKTGLAFF